jgi:hypothetical protein
MKECYADTNNYYILNLEKGTAIDSGLRGSAARFVNHSCSPNSEMQKWQVDGVPRIGLFSINSIPAGTELTYDYNFDWFEGAQMQICLCGEPNCRGFIGKKTLNQKSLTPTSTKSSESSSPVSRKGRKRYASSSKLMSASKVSKTKISRGKRIRSSTSSPTSNSVLPIPKIKMEATPAIPETEDEFEDIEIEQSDSVVTESTDTILNTTVKETLVSESESKEDQLKVSRKRGRPKGSKTQKPVLLNYYSNVTTLAERNSSQPLTRSQRNSLLTKNQEASISKLRATRKSVQRTKFVSSPPKDTSNDDDDHETVFPISMTPEPELSSTPAPLKSSPVLGVPDYSEHDEENFADISSTELHEEPLPKHAVEEDTIPVPRRVEKNATGKVNRPLSSTSRRSRSSSETTKASKTNFDVSDCSVSESADFSHNPPNFKVKNPKLSKNHELVQETPETDLPDSNHSSPVSRTDNRQQSAFGTPDLQFISPALQSSTASSSLTHQPLENPEARSSIKKSNSDIVADIPLARRMRNRSALSKSVKKSSVVATPAKKVPHSDQVLPESWKPVDQGVKIQERLSEPIKSASSSSSLLSSVGEAYVADTGTTTPSSIALSAPVYAPRQPVCETSQTTQPYFNVSSSINCNTGISPTSTSPYRSIINNPDDRLHPAMNVSQSNQIQQQYFYQPSPVQAQQHQQQQQHQPSSLNHQPQQSQQSQPLPKITMEPFQGVQNMIQSSTMSYIPSYSSSQQVSNYSGYYGKSHQYALVPIHSSNSQYSTPGYHPHHHGHVISQNQNIQHPPSSTIPTPLPSISSPEHMAPPSSNFLIQQSQAQSSQKQQQQHQLSQQFQPNHDQPYQQQQPYPHSQHFQQPPPSSQHQVHPSQLTSHQPVTDSYDQRRLSLPGNSGLDGTNNSEIHHHTLSSVSPGYSSILPPRPRSYSVYQSSTSNEGHSFIETPRNLITDPQNYRIQHHGSTGSDSNWRQQVSIQSLVSSSPSDSKLLQSRQETKASSQRTNSISSIVNPNDDYPNIHSVARKQSSVTTGSTASTSANAGPVLKPASSHSTPAATTPKSSQEHYKSTPVPVQSRDKQTKAAKTKELAKPKRGRPPNSTRLNLASPHPIAPLTAASGSKSKVLAQATPTGAGSIWPKTGSIATNFSEKPKKRSRASNSKPTATVSPANKPRRGRPPNSGPALRSFLAPLALRPQVLPTGGSTGISGSGGFPNRMLVKSNYLIAKPAGSGDRKLRLKSDKLSDQFLHEKRPRVGEDDRALVKRPNGLSAIIPSTHTVMIAPATDRVSKPSDIKGKGLESGTRSGRTESPKLTVSNAIKAAIGSNSKVTPVAVTPVVSTGSSGSLGLATVFAGSANEANFSAVSNNSTPKRGRGRPRIRPKDYWTYNNRKARGEFGPSNVNSKPPNSNDADGSNGTSQIRLTSMNAKQKSITIAPRKASSSDPAMLEGNNCNTAAMAATDSNNNKDSGQR